MAVTVEELRAVMRMEMKPFMRDLQQMNGVSAKAARQVEQTWRAANKRLDGIGKNMARSLVAPMAGIGAVLGADQLRKMTDQWTDMTSRVNLAAGSIDKSTEVMGRLGEMARRTYSDLTQTADSYLGNATALKDLGYNTDKTLDYTEALNNALVVSGAKGDRAASVIDALSKAMALGKLSGDNLNTVISTGGRVAEALAAGLGTTTNGLRRMGAQGKITGQDIVRGLTSQMQLLRKEAGDMPATIGDGFTLLNNAILQYVGNADTATGASRKIADALIIIADNFDKVADAGLQVAAVLAGALVGRSLAVMISKLGLAGAALINFTKALAAARTIGGLATAITGVGAAAGPVGMLVGGALVGSLLLYNQTVGKSSEGSEVYAKALEKVRNAAEKTGNEVENASEKIARGLPEKLEAGVTYSLKEIEDAVLRVVDEFDNLRNVSFEGVPQDEVDKVKELGERFKSGSISAADLAKELDSITRANPTWDNFTSSIEVFIGKLKEAAAASRILKAELADTLTSNGRSAKDDRLPIDVNKIAADSYEKEALRKAALNKKEHTLELERIKVRNDALKDGTKLTEQQIETISRANIAANERWSTEGKKPKAEKAPKKTEDDYFFQITQQVKDRTAALAEEAKITGLTYIEQEKRRTAMELEQDVLARLREEARKKGDKDWESVKLSSDQVASINAVSEAYARQADELRVVQEEQGKTEQAAAEFYDTFKSGVVGAITGANSLQDALVGILNKLAEMILNSAFDAIFGGANASRSGGWLTGMMKSIGFAEGGYTGPGGVNQPAGVVHKGEVVWSQKDVARAGGPSVVDAMRRGVSGYSVGGGVAMSIPRIPKMPVLKAPSSKSNAAPGSPGTIKIDVSGARGNAEIMKMVSAGVEQGLTQYDRELLPRRFRQIAQDPYAVG
ncbi:tape measure protein [Ochrobactrum sp. MYb379]|uniref:tape measure protein n=1 Tax=Ochrobactrum sp. MYb379 TaxID=2745275 RepID=UPI003096B18C